MNILLDGLDFDKAWAYDKFKEIIKSGSNVSVIPFSFHEEWIKNTDDWDKSYDKLKGHHYGNIVMPFQTYGIEEKNIVWINYFADNNDSAKEKVNSSDIIFFTGGFPDKIMNRLAEFDLINTIEQHKGIIMGWSAGAMMQCSDYYISPDKDYPEFSYAKGLNCIKDFAVEVHYKNTEVQNESIKKFIRETGKRVYTTAPQSAIIVDHGKATLLGNAKEVSISI
jgi:cyanophycinase